MGDNYPTIRLAAVQAAQFGLTEARVESLSPYS